jgi:hypothetical protein
MSGHYLSDHYTAPRGNLCKMQIPDKPKANPFVLLHYLPDSVHTCQMIAVSGTIVLKTKLPQQLQ